MLQRSALAVDRRLRFDGNGTTSIVRLLARDDQLSRRRTDGVAPFGDHVQ